MAAPAEASEPMPTPCAAAPTMSLLALDSPPSPTADYVGAARWSFARIISAHWPQNGSPERRKQGLEKILPVRPPVTRLCESNRLSKHVARGSCAVSPWRQARGQPLPMAFALLAKQEGRAPVVVGGGVLRELAAWAGVTSTELATAQGYGRACLALTVVVDGERRGQGHGRELVAQLEQAARERGFSCMCVSLRRRSLPESSVVPMGSAL